MSTYRPLARSFYLRSADEVAPDLLGRYLVRDLKGERLVLRIVETEAYLGAPDRASHAWGDRRTRRTEALFRRGGVAYVYFVYGLHFMFNVVTGGRADGSAVLVRAGEPAAGLETMSTLRGLGTAQRPGDVAGGPAKLCKALAIDAGLNRVALGRGALRVTRGVPLDAARIRRGPRVGIDYAGEAIDWPLRFCEAGNEHVSKPRLA